MLPARYRMTRSADFGTTVKRGVRAVQPDLVVHMRRSTALQDGPKVGLVVSKAVGGSVERHRVARRLRHLTRDVIAELGPGDQIVIRALPGSLHAKPQRLQQEFAAALARAHRVMEQAG